MGLEVRNSSNEQHKLARVTKKTSTSLVFPTSIQLYPPSAFSSSSHSSAASLPVVPPEAQLDRLLELRSGLSGEGMIKTMVKTVTSEYVVLDRVWGVAGIHRASCNSPSSVGWQAP